MMRKKPLNPFILVGTAITGLTIGSQIDIPRNSKPTAFPSHSSRDYCPAQEAQTNQLAAPIDYQDFFPEHEIALIQSTAQRVGIDADYLFAIRRAENGRVGLEFGVMENTPGYRSDRGIIEDGQPRPYRNEFEKQASWAAWTVRRSLQRYTNLSEHDRAQYTDFIDFLGDGYAPIGAQNDPANLNRHWETNVRHWFERLSR